PELRVVAVADLPRAAAIRPGGQPRHGAGLILAALFAGVGVMAGGAGLLVVRPLGRLTRAATKVAAGDLSVELPTSAGGEVGDLMRVFNNMVVRLREREAQGELERLSITDGLTGLYNRRHLMGTLANEVQRSRRLRRTFSVLLADRERRRRDVPGEGRGPGPREGGRGRPGVRPGKEGATQSGPVTRRARGVTALWAARDGMPAPESNGGGGSPG